MLDHLYWYAPMSERGVRTSRRYNVALTRCVDYGVENVSKAIQRQFELLGGCEKFMSRGDRVLLKPNFIVPRPASHPAQTHPEVILAVARIVKDLGCRPVVADSPAWNSFFACIKALDLEGELKKLGVEAVALNKPKRCRVNGVSVGISRVALEADRVINLPKLKAHQQLGATFAIKNMFGAVCGKEKALKHFTVGNNTENFCEMLLGVYRQVEPAVTIIDGVVAMEGNGPINGKAKQLGFFVGSSDPIAAEFVCCKLTKLDPLDIPIIQTAKKIGFGCSDADDIEILGDDPDELVCPDFLPAEQTDLCFSFSRVCKSVAKQIVYLTKSALKQEK